MTSQAKDDDCWNEIGTEGDRTCARLETYVHCRNCPVYSDKGRSLLNRPPPEDYIDEWKPILALAKKSETGDVISALVFRLGREWVALKSGFLEEILPRRIVHSIPHRTSAILLGLVNVRGELLLCISLAEILHLEVEEEKKQRAGGAVFGRLVVAAHSGDRWAFPVDEVDQIHRFPASELQAVPATMAKDASSCSQGIFALDSRRIALLDEQLLFDGLKRSLHWQATT